MCSSNGRSGCEGRKVDFRSSTLNFLDTYPRPKNPAYPARVLSDEGPPSRGGPSADRARAGRTGTPRDGRQAGGQGGAPGGAAPYVTGRARYLAARGGYVNPASKGATSLHPGASRRSITSRGSRGTGKPRTLCAARTRTLGCLNFCGSVRSPDGAQRNPGQALQHSWSPDFASLHPGYEIEACAASGAESRPPQFLP
jgi:hypothetical protein